MTLLSDIAIIERLSMLIDDPKRLVISPVDVHSLQGASYDLHLGDTLADEDSGFAIPEFGYPLRSGEAILGATIESVVIPADCAAMIIGKSSIGRRFLQVHCAGWLDPGFRGNITLQLINHNQTYPFKLMIGMPICQVIFYQLDQPAEKQYKGRYQDSEGTVSAKS